jgi:phosphoserine aminotransferase
MNSAVKTKPRVVRPDALPLRPFFSSGPCAKPPTWTFAKLRGALLGRSHRSREGKARLNHLVKLSRSLLEIPHDYLVAIVPGSDTGAVEMALWNLLGPRGVDLLAWDAFGHEWAKDVRDQLKIADTRVLSAAWGDLPDLNQVDGKRDTVFTWNGTTTGVKVPNADWIPADREGLTICDATSAAFATHLPWSKLDVTTWSWQKVLGGEAAHGMIALSPRAVERLNSYTPPWPMPKLLRLTRNGCLNEGVFRGETLNTPSMLAVEDAIVCLEWAHKVGGVDALARKAEQNLDVAANFIEGSRFFTFLPARADTRSATPVCLRLKSQFAAEYSSDVLETAVKRVSLRLASDGIAFDTLRYKQMPLGFRFWAGPTVVTRDLELALQWLEVYFDEAIHKRDSVPQPDFAASALRPHRKQS